MQSVKDSFDSDPDSSLQLLSLEEILKLKKKDKPPRGAAIPEGIAVGFRRASDLLRDAETAKVRFESLINDRELEEVVQKPKREEKKAITRVKSNLKTVRPRAKQEPEQCAPEAIDQPQINTSRFFAIEQDVSLVDGFKQQHNGANHLQTLERLDVDDEQALALPGSEVFSLTEDDARPSLALLKESKPRSRKTTQIKKPSSNHQTVPSVGENPDVIMLETDFPDKQSIGVDGTLIKSITVHDSNETEKDHTVVDDFRNLVHAYSYHEQSAISDNGIQSLVPPNLKPPARQNQPSVQKLSPKKHQPKRITSPNKRKLLTITEKAIQEFRPEEVPDTLSLLEYFPISDPGNLPESVTTAVRAQPKIKPKTTNRRKKPEKRSSLLPPSDALESLNDQKFVFNTSSQLMIHSSSPGQKPSDIVENTMPRAATVIRDDSFIDLDSLLASAGTMGFKSTKSLWSAAKRDEDGSLLASDLIETSMRPTTMKKSRLEESVTTSMTADLDSRCVTNSEATGDTDRGREPTVSVLPLEPATHVVKSIPALPRSLGEAATRQRPTSKSPVKKKRKAKDSEPKPMKPEDCFKKVPLNDLKEELKKFGVKPPRSRVKMVELILQCRAQPIQNTTTSTGLLSTQLPEAVPTSIHGHTANPLIPSPVKAVVARSKDPDSEVALSPLVQSVPVSSQAKQQLQPDVIAVEDFDSLPPPSFQRPAEQSESHEQVDQTKTAALIQNIHLAISSQPPTHSIASPSWREKMAMYDPIILEELTTWLNTGGLDAIGIDEEVSPDLVRDWCESKSVCFISASGGWRKKRLQ